MPFDPPAPPCSYWLLGRRNRLRGEIHVQRQPGFRTDCHAKYSRRSRQRLVDGLESSYLYAILVGFHTYETRGRRRAS